MGDFKIWTASKTQNRPLVSRMIKWPLTSKMVNQPLTSKMMNRPLVSKIPNQPLVFKIPNQPLVCRAGVILAKAGERKKFVPRGRSTFKNKERGRGGGGNITPYESFERHSDNEKDGEL